MTTIVGGMLASFGLVVVVGAGTLGYVGYKLSSHVASNYWKGVNQGQDEDNKISGESIKNRSDAIGSLVGIAVTIAGITAVTAAVVIPVANALHRLAIGLLYHGTIIPRGGIRP